MHFIGSYIQNRIDLTITLNYITLTYLIKTYLSITYKVLANNRNFGDYTY